MKSIFTPSTLISALLLIFLAIGTARAQEPRPTIKKVPVQTTRAIAGKDLYREYCAVCHGALGAGDGPAAAALKTPPANLTQIAKANGGKFPEVKVQHIIEGEKNQPIAHGSKEMPVWGFIFRHMGNPDLGAARVYNLVKYIEEMQAK